MAHDVRQVQSSVLVESEWPDVIVGGFPCQDVSRAGRQGGLGLPRSGLFFQFARVVGEMRPRWAIIENVPGLLGSNGGADFATVVGSLADTGYVGAWRVFDSRWFGVPQRRRRVWIVARRADHDPVTARDSAREILAVGHSCPIHPLSDGEVRASSAERGGGRAATDSVICFSHTQGLNPQPSNAYWPALREQGGGSAVYRDGHVRRLTPVECERLQGWPDEWTDPEGRNGDKGRFRACGDGATAPVARWIASRIMKSG